MCRRGHQSRILSAVHWAGRAAVNQRPEEAFLHRTISLESVMLGKTEAEITTRLTITVAKSPKAQPKVT